ncbi:MAG: Uma2 family endonuclease [Tunicatimonas sp.]
MITPIEALNHQKLSLADYQRLEEQTDTRYEYHDGEVFAMSGAARKHSAIASNVGRNLGNILPKGCRTFDSDLKVYVEAVNKGFHPDVSVACRPITGPDEINAIDNPVLLVEVISEGSANYDPVSTAGGQKFWYYSHLPSLREYVLIEQDRPAVEVRYRSSATADWVMAYHEGEEAEVVLRSPLAQVYEDTDGL